MNIVPKIKHIEFNLWYDIRIYKTVPCPVENRCTACSVMYLLRQPRSGIMMCGENNAQ